MASQFMRTAFAAILAALAAALPGVSGRCLAQTVWEQNGAAVCTAAASQESPNLASLGADGVVMVWADGRSGEYDIYAQRLDAGGTPQWAPDGVRVCGAEYDQQFPLAVPDGAGGVIVVWQDGRKGDDGMEIYAQRLCPDGSPAWTPDGVPVCTHAPDLADPPTAFSHVVCSDGSGGVITAWRDTRSDPVLANTEIYAQRVSSSGTALWALNGVKVLGFGAKKWATRNPIIASDGSGGAVIVWQDARNSATTANDLYAQRVTAAGSAAWTANGQVLCNAAGEQGYPDITEIVGGVAVVWEDKRSGGYDIYAQRLDLTGAAAWGANGRSVCTSPNDQRTPRVVDNGLGGLIVAWTDSRNSTTQTDVYAQTLDASGNPLWAAQGVAACLASGSQTRIRMAQSLPGSVVLTWMDTRNEVTVALYDIYGQMLGSDGLPLWAADGLADVDLPGSNQRLQQTLSDGARGVYTVWEDNRNAGNWDVYGHRLSPWASVRDTAEAKLLPTGSAVLIPPKVVTAAFNGYFYIEEIERYSGLKVVSDSPVSPGDLVTVGGTVGEDCERLINASAVVKSGTADIPRPLGLRLSAIGGEGIGSSHGLGNTGLLVRAWGRVVARESGPPQSVILTDGVTAVRVHTESNAAVGDYVVATGISSCRQGQPASEPALLSRSISDVLVILEGP